MTETPFSGALQENVLTLLCFDTDSAKLIRNVVKPELFATDTYRQIAVKAIFFLDTYADAIGDHLPDEFQAELAGRDKKVWEKTLSNLFAASKRMNSTYIIDQLKAFVHEQTLKQGMLLAMDHMEAGNIADAEVALTASMAARIDTFDTGIVFSDPKQALSFFDHVEDTIPMGIADLDRRGVCPAPGTQFVFIAPAKKGKSWFLIHVGKGALMTRKRVLHVTLEMPEPQVAQRYVQALYSYTKREAIVEVPKFKLDAQGRFVGVDFEEVTRPTFSDPASKKRIAKELKDHFRSDAPLIIKSFPTGSLTIAEYNAYLDTLERLNKFVPDVVLLDYPALMQLDTKNLRVDLGRIFKDLRGVAQKRNHALVVVTQGNRDSADARTTTDTNVAEDYSIIGTADNVVTYSQTLVERKKGIARLFVSNARGDEDKFTILITQAYAMGQFCLDSKLMVGDYWDRLTPPNPQAGDDE